MNKEFNRYDFQLLDCIQKIHYPENYMDTRSELSELLEAYTFLKFRIAIWQEEPKDLYSNLVKDLVVVSIYSFEKSNLQRVLSWAKTYDERA